MGLTDREYYRDEYEGGVHVGRDSVVIKLIVVNCVVFIGDMLFGGGAHRVMEWLALRPSDLLQPWYWWRLLTFGFCHDPNQVGHIFLNMFMLFMFGREVEAIYGPRRLVRLYLSAIVLGGLVWTLREWAMDPQLTHPTILMGASGAVTAVFMLFVLHYPRRTLLLFFVLPVPAWFVGILYVLIDLMGFQTVGATDGAQVAFDVHLTGAAFAFFYWRFGRRWERSSIGSKIAAWNPFKRRPKLRVMSDRDERASTDNLDKQADAILDKVNQFGIDSLTPRERRVLEAYSRRMQQKFR